MRANIQRNAQQGGNETRGAGVGGTKQWGTDTLGDLWKGEGWDGEHEEEKMDMTGTFRKESRGIEGSGLGWIIEARKDRGFVWGMIRGGGEQLF